MIRHCLILAALLFCARAAFAHDMWLEPGSFQGSAGEPIELTLLVGDQGRVQDVRPLGLDRAYRFQLYDNGKFFDVRYPEGVGAVVMERLPAYISFDSEKFNDYVAEEGHAVRAPAGTRVRERYTRHIKTIVTGSEARDDDFKRAAGMILELIPLDDPRTAGDSFSVVALFEGKPLREARIAVYSNGVEQIVRTNRRGWATFRVSGAGEVLVRTTLLRPCRCDDADYESFWGALTFSTARSESSNPSSPRRTAPARERRGRR